MTPEEKYTFDVRGYLIVENAIDPDYLDQLNSRLDAWEGPGRSWHKDRRTSKPGDPTSGSLIF